MMSKRLPIWSLIAVFGVVVPLAAEEGSLPILTQEDLATPQKTVQNFFQYAMRSEPEHDFRVAAQCFDLSQIEAGSDTELFEKGADLAEMFLTALDAKGYYIKWRELPSDAETKALRIVIHEETPQFYLEKRDGKWLLSSYSVSRIEPFYNAAISAQARWVVEHLPAFMRGSVLGIYYWQLVGVFLVLLVAFAARRGTLYFGENYLGRLTRSSRFNLDDEIRLAVIKPLGLAIFAGVIWACFPSLQFGVAVSRVVRVAVVCFMTVSVIWLIYRTVDVLAAYLEKLTEKTESKLDDQLIPIIRKTLKVFVVIVGVLFTLQNLDVNVSSFLAGLGLGGLAFALAAQDSLSNLFGSIMILLDRPFHIGDWVIIGGVEGTVEEVGLRSTRVRTFYKSLVTIPNSNLVKTPIDNMGARTYRRIKTYISVTYDTPPEKMEAFVEGIRQIIHSNEYTWKDYYHVYFNQFAASSLDVLLYCFVDTKDWSVELQERHRIFLEIMRLAQELGIEFAFPTQTLHVDSFPGQATEPVARDQAAKEMAEIAAAFGPGGRLARPESVDMKALAGEEGA